MKKKLSFIIAIAVIIGTLAIGCNLGDKPESESTIVITEEYSTENQNTDAEIYGEEKPVITKQETSSLKTESRPADVVTEEIVDTVYKKNICSLTVECSDILNGIESLEEAKRKLVSENGVIFSMENIEFTDGESVFDVLKRELKKAGIPVEFSLTPVYNSAYIEGINNIYEFDCGERSGWKYSVNGRYPPVACSDYKLNNTDKIVFVYKIKAY